MCRTLASKFCVTSDSLSLITSKGNLNLSKKAYTTFISVVTLTPKLGERSTSPSGHFTHKENIRGNLCWEDGKAPSTSGRLGDEINQFPCQQSNQLL
jgi:hypothetical protein